MRTPPELTPFEAVVGLPLGGRARRVPSPPRPGARPLDALVVAISRTLRGGAPAVAFSGGRDSSLLLAVAAHACRVAGMEPPLPVTLCAPDALLEAQEDEWQERVLDHLGIRDWKRVQIVDELDLIGAYARPHLLRDGPFYPANAHSVLPLLDAAADRPLIVGLGGDEILSPQQWRPLHDLVARRRAPQRRDVIRLGACALPRQVRGLARPSYRPELEELGWLAPQVRSRLDRSLRRRLEEPIHWGAAVRHLAARRDVVLPLQTMQRLARSRGKTVVAPLLDAHFVGALARTGGASGWGTRSGIMDALARDLLPSEVIRRQDKAGFNRLFFGRPSRAFAQTWSGRGLDATLVDPDRLRREWLSEFPDFRTALLLQAAWLAERSPDRAATP